MTSRVPGDSGLDKPSLSRIPITGAEPSGAFREGRNSTDKKNIILSVLPPAPAPPMLRICSRARGKRRKAEEASGANAQLLFL